MSFSCFLKFKCHSVIVDIECYLDSVNNHLWDKPLSTSLRGVCIELTEERRPIFNVGSPILSARIPTWIKRGVIDISAIIHLSLGRLPDCVCGSRALLEKAASCSCPLCFPGIWVSKIHFRKCMLHVLFIVVKGGLNKVKIMNREKA